MCFYAPIKTHPISNGMNPLRSGTLFSFIVIGIIILYGLFGFTNFVPDLSIMGIVEMSGQKQIEVARQEAREQFSAQLVGPADYENVDDEFLRQRIAEQAEGLTPRGGADPPARATGVGGQPVFDGVLGEAMSSQDQPQKGERAKVKRVIDGDTIMLSSGEYVRYIGVDAPEQQSSYNKTAECYAEESKQRNIQLVFNQEVLLLSKPDEDTDDYGRLLRYVWVGDTHINN